MTYYLFRETSNLKKYLSSEYGRKKDLLDEITRNLVAKVQRHPADFDSTEVQSICCVSVVRGVNLLAEN